MAIRKMSDLYFPEHYRLMLDNGKWYLYDNEMACPVDTVDRRFAFRLIDTGFVDNKRVDFLGRLMYDRRTKGAVDVAIAPVTEDESQHLAMLELDIRSNPTASAWFEKDF